MSSEREVEMRKELSTQDVGVRGLPELLQADANPRSDETYQPI